MNGLPIGRPFMRTAWERLAFGECGGGAAFPRPHTDVLPIGACAIPAAAPRTPPPFLPRPGRVNERSHSGEGWLVLNAAHADGIQRSNDRAPCTFGGRFSTRRRRGSCASTQTGQPKRNRFVDH